MEDLISFGGLTSPPSGGGWAGFPRRTSGAAAGVLPAGVTVLAVTVAPSSAPRCTSRFALGVAWPGGRALSTPEAALALAGTLPAADCGLSGEFAAGFTIDPSCTPEEAAGIVKGWFLAVGSPRFVREAPVPPVRGLLPTVATLGDFGSSNTGGAGGSVREPAFTVLVVAPGIPTAEASFCRMLMYLNSGNTMTAPTPTPTRIPRTNCILAAVR